MGEFLWGCLFVVRAIERDPIAAGVGEHQRRWRRRRSAAIVHLPREDKRTSEGWEVGGAAASEIASGLRGGGR